MASGQGNRSHIKGQRQRGSRRLPEGRRMPNLPGSKGKSPEIVTNIPPHGEMAWAEIIQC